ncbi:hypothetical protein AXG93_2786s1020 [Marchantia polymorpha subsp. ruderalis]|uniref:Uncharacterized protein n=2 Tax=Marchantia polymorpha TaxID=3197 RepID=A0A176W435_MARPO|nr:hypothetical protein AXG93_2786s1020 [Marchantia polymorpha subsp. ruderalis]
MATLACATSALLLSKSLGLRSCDLSDAYVPRGRPVHLSHLAADGIPFGVLLDRTCCVVSTRIIGRIVRTSAEPHSEDLSARMRAARQIRFGLLLALLAAVSIQGMADHDLSSGFLASSKALAIESRQSVLRLGLANLTWGKFAATYAVDWAQHYGTTADLVQAQSQQTCHETVQFASWALNRMEQDAKDTLPDEIVSRSHLVKKLFGRYPPVAYVFN